MCHKSCRNSFRCRVLIFPEVSASYRVLRILLLQGSRNQRMLLVALCRSDSGKASMPRNFAAMVAIAFERCLPQLHPIANSVKLLSLTLAHMAYTNSSA